MANTLKADESNIIVGLGSYTHTCGSTAMYDAGAKATMQPGSSLSIVISQAGSTTASITSTAPVADQNHVEVQKLFNCVSGDVITVAISSAAAIDNQLNNVKTLVNIRPAGLN